MKILLDECLDRRLVREFSGHIVKTAPQMKWAGIKNGRLLALAEKQFDVFVTVDRNLSFQQHLPRFRIAVVILRARSNRLEDLRGLIPTLLASLPTLKIGKAVTVS